MVMTSKVLKYQNCSSGLKFSPQSICIRSLVHFQYIALKFQHFFDYFSFFNFRGIVMTFHDISTVFLHNRLENQVLDTYGGHLKVQKAIQKTSKDLMFFSVQMLCSWFCRRDMGHRHLCFWFCRLGNLQNHEQKKNVQKKCFTRIFPCFCQQMVKTKCKFRFPSVRLLPPRIVAI